MTPEKYSDHRVIYPAFVQPSMQGIRTIYQNGTFQSTCDWSLEIKEIALDLQEILPPKVILDGVIHQGNYYIFDKVSFKVSFKERFDPIVQVLRDAKNYHTTIVVPTHKVSDEKEANILFDRWRYEAYTGMIYRLGHCLYTKPTSKNPKNISNQLLLREII